MNISLNSKAIFKILGIILIIESISLVFPIFCAYIYREKTSLIACIITFFITALLGLVMYLRIKPSSNKFYLREGYILVTFCWLIVSLFGALPYFLSGIAKSYVDALFQAVAGFTTTGSTVMNMGSMPHSLLLWQSISHWLGGMGILIFVISVLPALGIRNSLVAKAETPGPVFEKMAIKTTDSAKLLYLTYIAFTVIEFILLNLSDKMSAFDAFINTCGSVSTSGLFSHPDGITYYNDIYIEMVIALFTILSSINFVLYGYLAKRDYKRALQDIEMRFFFIILASATLICFLGLYFIGDSYSASEALRYSFFQVTGFITTSGYTSCQFSDWPVLCQTVLFGLFFIGGCSGSTCGSVKVIRILVMIKVITRGFVKRIHPRSVVAVKIKGDSVPAPLVAGISSFILMYVGIFILACIVLSFQGLDMETTISTAAGILSNTGVALGDIGASCNYAVYSAPLKVFLCLLMVIGRLELFTVIILCTRSFWGKGKGR